MFDKKLIYISVEIFFVVISYLDTLEVCTYTIKISIRDKSSNQSQFKKP